MCATFKLATGSDTLGSQARWVELFFLLLVLLVLHLVELVAFCFRTLFKWLFIKSLSTWCPRDRESVCGCVSTYVWLCVSQCSCVSQCMAACVAVCLQVAVCTARTMQSWRWSSKITLHIFHLCFVIFLLANETDLRASSWLHHGVCSFSMMFITFPWQQEKMAALLWSKRKTFQLSAKIYVTFLQRKCGDYEIMQALHILRRNRQFMWWKCGVFEKNAAPA